MSKISELSDGGSLVSSDYLIAVRSGGNVKVRMDQINVDQVDLGDNEFIRLGNSQDLTMVHTSTQSIINQAGIGDLLIQKAGATKLTINASGIDVTGSVTATTATGSASPTPTKITIATSTSAGDWSTTAPWGRLAFYSADASAGGAKEEVTLDVVAAQAAGGVSDFTINTYNSGAKERLRISHDGNLSLYEDTGTTPKLAWSATNERLTLTGSDYQFAIQQGANEAWYTRAVSDGTFRLHRNGTGDIITASATGIDVTGAATFSGSVALAGSSGGLLLNNSATADNTIQLNTTGGTTFVGANGSAGNRFIGSSAYASTFGTTAANALELATANTVRMTISSTGAATFGGTLSSGGITTTGNTAAGTASAGDGRLFPNNTYGAFVYGNGTTYDVALGQRSTGVALGVLAGTTNVVIPGGNVGIGTGASSPLSKLNVKGTQGNWRVDPDSVSGEIQVLATTTTNDGFRNFRLRSNEIIFEAGGTEAMRIDDGNLLVGTTDTLIWSDTSGEGVVIGPNAIQVARTSDTCLLLNRQSTDGILQVFASRGVQVGAISVDVSSTAYNTSSDQRLKLNITDADDAGSKIDAIQVRKFDWKVDGSHQDYGMVAQELIEVAPEAVSAPEDPEEMMGVDYSKLVPMMLKEIQSLRARIAALES